jgi:hypothetical protein
MRLANSRLGDELTSEEIEAELDAILEAFCIRWLGPGKKPCA